MMAHWNSESGKIIYFKEQQSEIKGWNIIDCGCCGGLRWGGEEPIECNYCEGNGHLFKHIKSGVIAIYPGGEFRGREKPMNEQAKGEK